MTQYTSNIDILLLLCLDLFSSLLLLLLLTIQIGGQVRLSSRGSRLLVHSVCDLSLSRCGHLLSIKLLVSAHGLVGLTLGLFTRGSTTDTARY